MQRRTLFIAGLALAAASSAFAQASKPIRLIVPYAPGGPLDVTARALAERVEGKLGTIIVENKPGAGRTTCTCTTGCWPGAPRCRT